MDIVTEKPAAPSMPLAIETLNRTGYPLQIALAQETRAHETRHGWRVIYQEHAWRALQGDESGYLDLVLENPRIDTVLVIECKRTQNKEWAFLHEVGSDLPRRAAHGLVAPIVNGLKGPNCPYWQAVAMEPSTPIATFCAMPKDARDPSVDALASELVLAAEGLAKEEVDTYLKQRGGDARRLYLAAIVTTADLTACGVDLQSISLSDGQLPANARMTSVRAVRFTKQLESRATVMYQPQKFGYEAAELARAKERTVFVVRADALTWFLSNIGVDGR
jgi:hypothetical protein